MLTYMGIHVMFLHKVWRPLALAPIPLVKKNMILENLSPNNQGWWCGLLYWYCLNMALPVHFARELRVFQWGLCQKRSKSLSKFYGGIMSKLLKVFSVTCSTTEFLCWTATAVLHQSSCTPVALNTTLKLKLIDFALFALLMSFALFMCRLLNINTQHPN